MPDKDAVDIEFEVVNLGRPRPPDHPGWVGGVRYVVDPEPKPIGRWISIACAVAILVAGAAAIRFFGVSSIEAYFIGAFAGGMIFISKL